MPANKSTDEIMRAGLRSLEGQEMLHLLKEMYVDGDLFDENPFRMAQKVGARDVIMFMSEFLPKEE